MSEENGSVKTSKSNRTSTSSRSSNQDDEKSTATSTCPTNSDERSVYSSSAASIHAGQAALDRAKAHAKKYSYKKKKTYKQLEPPPSTTAATVNNSSSNSSQRSLSSSSKKNNNSSSSSSSSKHGAVPLSSELLSQMATAENYQKSLECHNQILLDNHPPLLLQYISALNDQDKLIQQELTKIQEKQARLQKQQMQVKERLTEVIGQMMMQSEGGIQKKISLYVDQSTTEDQEALNTLDLTEIEEQMIAIGDLSKGGVDNTSNHQQQKQQKSINSQRENATLKNIQLEQSAIESYYGKNKSSSSQPKKSSSSSASSSVGATERNRNNDYYNPADNSNTQNNDTIEELVINGFKRKDVMAAYEIFGDNFEELLTYLASTSI